MQPIPSSLAPKPSHLTWHQDDTIEILEVHDNNNGLDPYPALLRRGLMPKVGTSDNGFFNYMDIFSHCLPKDNHCRFNLDLLFV